MSLFNQETKELHCKIVYYGPSLGGKTTNLQWIYHETAPDQKSKLTALNPEPDRTYFFDFLPFFMGEVRGYKTRFHIYTVPGQMIYNASRKLILQGIDGVIFVADSQKERMDENIESMKNLELNLKQQGYDIRKVPLLIQYNKRDLDNASSIEELRTALNKYNAMETEAIASEGKGVFESLKKITKHIHSVLKGGEV